MILKILNSVLFLLSLVLAWVFFFVYNPNRQDIEYIDGKAYLSDEKRALTEIPELTFTNYISGEWAEQMDLFINDNFPFRSYLSDWAVDVRKWRGIEKKEQKKVVYIELPPEIEIAPEDTLAAEQQAVEGIDESYKHGMLIVNGRVFPLGGGNPALSPYFSEMVSNYAQQLAGECRVFSAVPPLSSAFIPSSDYTYLNRQNKRTLLAIKENLKHGALFADVFSELDQHKDIQLYFGSDHHWKPIGAYYAYVAFCKAAGITPVPLDNMEKRYKTDFLGTMYQLTRDDTVKENPDDMEYYIPNVTTKAIRFEKAGFENPKRSLVFSHGSKGPYTYSTFLSGDHPLMKITTSIKNGKKAVVIKNSMGNAFSVYLISHYEEIWVVDFRYSQHNLIQLIRNNTINDLIFAVGMNHANNPNTVRMMKRLGTQSGELIPEKPAVSDSSNVDGTPDSLSRPNDTINPPLQQNFNPTPIIQDTLLKSDTLK